MPFNTNEGLGYLGNKITSMPVVGGMLQNPINTAVLIALIILLINMFVFRNTDTGESSLFILSLRSALYILVLATGIIFLHNQHFLNELKKKEGSAELDSVFVGGAVGNSIENIADEIDTLSDTKLIPVEIDI